MRDTVERPPSTAEAAGLSTEYRPSRVTDSRASICWFPRWSIQLTLVVAALLTVTSLGGLLSDSTYLDVMTSMQMAESQGQDLVSLLVALPLLGVSVLRARRGDLGAVAVWAGTLAYVTYVAVAYAFSGIDSSFFLAYLATLGLGGITLGRLADHGAGAVPSRNHTDRSGRLAWFFWSTAALPAVGLVTLTVGGSSDGRAVEGTGLVVAGLVVVLPASIVVGVGLQQRRRWAPFMAAAVVVFDAVFGLSVVMGQLVAHVRGIDPAWGLGLVAVGFAFAARRLWKPTVWALDHAEPFVKKVHRRRWPWAIAAVVLVAGGGFFALRALRDSIGEDYTSLTWTEAFAATHEQVAQRYPFTEWKQVDWDAAYAAYAPRIAAAQAADDFDAYYLAVREYAHSVADSHMHFSGDDRGTRDRAVGGSYGLGIIELDDGRVIAHVIDENGPAAAAGLSWGDEIVAWNGQPVESALEDAPILWADTIAATEAARDSQRLHYLVRGPVGSTATATFAGEDGSQRSATLAAFDDGYDTLEASTVHAMADTDLSDFVAAKLVDSTILESGYGYIDVESFLFTVRQPRVATAFGWIVTDLIDDEVPGIIIDVRGNGGGVDAAAVAMLSHFVEERTFYQDIATIERGELVIDPQRRNVIEPGDTSYDGPIVVLVDGRSLSTAEGIPMIAQRLPQATVIGMEQTGGAFAQGDFDALFKLPDGLVLSFLERASLDADGAIQIDADATGHGGVVPDIKVPLTEVTVRAVFVDDTDVVLQTAIDHFDRLTK